VPPPEERGALRREGHAHRHSAPLRGGRTLSLLQNTYWWPGMAREVKGHVAQCLQCDRVQEQGGGGQAESAEFAPGWGGADGGPWTSLVSCPVSRKGKKYILVIIDHALQVG